MPTWAVVLTTAVSTSSLIITVLVLYTKFVAHVTAQFAGLRSDLLVQSEKHSSAVDTIEAHTEALTRVSDRMDRHEQAVFKLVADVQRLIGRIDGLRDDRNLPR
jgi:hypothetical protein